MDTETSDQVSLQAADLRADIVGYVESENRQNHLECHLPESIESHLCESMDELSSQTDGNVAIALFSNNSPQETIRSGIREVLTQSQHTQIALIGRDATGFPGPELFHDEVFDYPIQKEVFRDRFERLYLRSFYSATLDRFYNLTLTAHNLRLRLKRAGVGKTGRLENLESAIKRLKAHLRFFRKYLETEDIEAILGRDERMENHLDGDTLSSDPTRYGLPEKCPSCDISWTEWHGKRLGYGYESTGANTWHCISCGYVIANPGVASQWIT